MKSWFPPQLNYDRLSGPSRTQERQFSGHLVDPAKHTLTCHHAKMHLLLLPHLQMDHHYLSRERSHCRSLPLCRAGESVTVVWFAVEFTCRQQEAGEKEVSETLNSELDSLVFAHSCLSPLPTGHCHHCPGFLYREAKPSL